MTLLWLLLGIFGGLAAIVLITERFAKPMSQEQMSRLSPWLIGLVFALLITQLIYYLLKH